MLFRSDEAEKLFVDVVNATNGKLGSDHPHTLTSMANLACTYLNQGRWDEAEKLFVDVLNARNGKLGSDHPHTLNSMANLAFTYWDQSRLDEAHSLLLYAANTMQQVMGPQHPTALQHIEHFNRLVIEMGQKECQDTGMSCIPSKYCLIHSSIASQFSGPVQNFTAQDKA